ncbi:MAG: YihY/virulence factor BrkB family protein [Sphingobacteriia bacterium]|nr:MAG: YihY/virulence factor BrkB family protein [Sphingobacteriia bacterium]
MPPFYQQLQRPRSLCRGLPKSLGQFDAKEKPIALTKLERLIWEFPPIAFVVRKSKHLRLPGFRGIPLYDVVLFFVDKVKAIGLNERAAAISFNLIMALPATVLFLFSIIPYLPDIINLKTQILDIFKDISPSSHTKQFIENLLEDLVTRNVGVFSFGFLLILFYASNAMMALIRTFDKSILENKTFFLHQRIRALHLTLLLMVLVISSALVLLGQEQLVVLVKKLFNWRVSSKSIWLSWLRWLVIFLLFFYGIALIYRYAPSVKEKWPLASPGSLLATFLTIGTTGLFSYWVNNFAAYNKIYGSIGTVLILMLLIYINSLILLIGFELNVSITALNQQAAQRNQSTHNP